MEYTRVKAIRSFRKSMVGEPARSCPFCGRHLKYGITFLEGIFEDKDRKRIGPHWISVDCDHCDAQGPYVLETGPEPFLEAEEKWNRRHA